MKAIFLVIVLLAAPLPAGAKAKRAPASQGSKNFTFHCTDAEGGVSAIGMANLGPRDATSGGYHLQMRFHDAASKQGSQVKELRGDYSVQGEGYEFRMWLPLAEAFLMRLDSHSKNTFPGIEGEHLCSIDKTLP